MNANKLIDDVQILDESINIDKPTHSGQVINEPINVDEQIDDGQWFIGNELNHNNSYR
ncbi:hypothetical protein BLA29_015039 [Euroglyphus maynei]|uniref:Uncharacterized protein n=1 Tax=Euroglyphus maynei TaxID=6958 RepID=A0A1Y3BKA0_EURMA|nr:hypothetical protein BLA29_015039 [Euroglyphus maynei]